MILLGELSPNSNMEAAVVTGREPPTLLKTTRCGRGAAGSHAGSHTDEQPFGFHGPIWTTGRDEPEVTN